MSTRAALASFPAKPRPLRRIVEPALRSAAHRKVERRAIRCGRRVDVHGGPRLSVRLHRGCERACQNDQQGSARLVATNESDASWGSECRGQAQDKVEGRFRGDRQMTGQIDPSTAAAVLLPQSWDEVDRGEPSVDLTLLLPVFVDEFAPGCDGVVLGGRAVAVVAPGVCGVSHQT